MKSDTPLSFSLLTPDQLDVIRPLWEQLNQHHATLPTPFAPEIAARSSASRLQAFRDIAASGRLRVEVAGTGADEPPVAFCVTSLSPDGAGEVDSLYVAPLHRRTGVGSELLRRALDWLHASGAVTQRVTVLHANAEAASFYQRFGFHPRNVEFELLRKTHDA